jgi:chromatin remodeling complex protein RSC6
LIKKKRKTVKRKTVKRKTVSKKSKTVSKKSKTKKPFGGYTVSFKNRKETLEQVFGKASIPPSQMTKKLWKFVKAKRLGHK